MTDTYDRDCTDCPRLAALLEDVRSRYPEYHARPVPSFGSEAPRLLIVGLAPGMHGANATGRAFTGDYAGVLLYETLHAVGIASRQQSVSADDGLELAGTRITNAVKCLPPQNKPVAVEVNTCASKFLVNELAEVNRDGGVLLALGGISHKAIIRTLGMRQADYPFAHGAEHHLPDGRVLVDSYHCSRYNTQTRRLTPAMFLRAVERAARLAQVGNFAA
ncbi:MAG: uracil-DNA glycosylase [Pseudomonadota bacterium]